MSKRKRRSTKERMRAEQREYLPIANKVAAPSIVRLLEDRREYAPVDTYPRGLFHRSTRKVVREEPQQRNVNKARRNKNDVPSKVMFQVPQEVALCVRRKQRREVLFALRKHGKGAKSKFRRRTEYSKMEC